MQRTQGRREVRAASLKKNWLEKNGSSLGIIDQGVLIRKKENDEGAPGAKEGGGAAFRAMMNNTNFVDVTWNVLLS